MPSPPPWLFSNHTRNFEHSSQSWMVCAQRAMSCRDGLRCQEGRISWLVKALTREAWTPTPAKKPQESVPPLGLSSLIHKMGTIIVMVSGASVYVRPCRVTFRGPFLTSPFKIAGSPTWSHPSCSFPALCPSLALVTFWPVHGHLFVICLPRHKLNKDRTPGPFVHCCILRVYPGPGT